ncbi:MAG: ABC transporter permease [Pseudomonadota bacterium]|nr:ABC transporter permease [Pseudomonadota bacterium]
MLGNYLKIALRSIGGSRVHSAINIVGLGIGLACCILILLFVRFELSFDKQFAQADRIYRISREYFPVDGARARVPASNNAPVAPALLEDFPEIEAAARIFGGGIVLAKDETSFVEPGLRYADNAVFDIFDFEWLAGDPAQALGAPSGIVLTESLARKYFNRSDVVGETLRANNSMELVVSGVIRDLPANTHLDFSGLVSINATIAAFGPNFLSNWNASTDYYTYILLRDGTNPASIESGIPAFIDRHMAENASALSTMRLMNVRDIHLHSRMDEEWKDPGNLNTVYAFAGIAFAILVIACINFMSIATARSTQRAKEIGMRVSIGASRRQLIGQFLGESALTAGIAMVGAIILVEILLPVFRVFVGAHLDFNLISDLDLLLSLLGLTIFVALFAGSYPAFYLSAYEPSRVLKGDLTRGRSGLLFRNGLVVLQFAVAIALVVSTVVIYQQRQLAANMELGFDKDQVVVIPSAAPGGFAADWGTLKTELLQSSAIENVSISHYLPFGFNDNQYPVRRRGSTAESRIQIMIVDYDFFATYGIDLVAGRVFSEGIASDLMKLPTNSDPSSNISYVLNESAAKLLGLDMQALDNEVLEFAGAPIAGPVVGVVEDTYFESVRRNVRPLMFLLAPPHIARQAAMRDGSVRVRAGSEAAALAHIDAVWSRLYPGQENNRYFLDNDFRAMYLAEEKQGELFSWFSLLAILIACLGLYGLASFNAERRTKEIGVRKVMGGSVWSIVLLLTNDFSKLVLLANVIAWPLAYVAMQRWLEQFVYRIDLTPVIFIGSGLIALCIAWVTVGGTAAKAASAKPVLALRYE